MLRLYTRSCLGELPRKPGVSQAPWAPGGTGMCRASFFCMFLHVFRAPGEAPSLLGRGESGRHVGASVRLCS